MKSIVKAGRPESAEPTKQINVRMKLSKLSDPKLQERIKYLSFSQYVNSLIDADLERVAI